MALLFSFRRFFLAVLRLFWLSVVAFFICSLKASFLLFIKPKRVLSDSVNQSGWLGFSVDADSVAALTMCSSKLFMMSEGVAYMAVSIGRLLKKLRTLVWKVVSA